MSANGGEGPVEGWIFTPTPDREGRDRSGEPAHRRGEAAGRGGEAAGQAAEDAALKAAADTIRDFSHEVFANVRVPRSKERGKYEIDALVVGPDGIVGLEVKGWSGRVSAIAGGRWRQTRGPREAVDHDDPVVLMERKMAALRSYLADVCSLPLPADLFHHAVVVTHPQLELGGSLASNPLIVRLDALPEWLLSRVQLNPPGWGPWLKRLLRLTPRVGGGVPAGANQMVARLPTWDEVQLKSGEVMKGDLHRLKIQLDRGPTLGRVQTKGRLTLSGVEGRRQVQWRGPDGRSTAARIRTGQSLSLKPAGRGGVPTPVDLAQVAQITLGYLDESHYDPPDPRRAQRTRELTNRVYTRGFKQLSLQVVGLGSALLLLVVGSAVMAARGGLESLREGSAETAGTLAETGGTAALTEASASTGDGMPGSPGAGVKDASQVSKGPALLAPSTQKPSPAAGTGSRKGRRAGPDEPKGRHLKGSPAAKRTPPQKGVTKSTGGKGKR